MVCGYRWLYWPTCQQKTEQRTWLASGAGHARYDAGARYDARCGKSVADGEDVTMACAVCSWATSMAHLDGVCTPPQMVRARRGFQRMWRHTDCVLAAHARTDHSNTLRWGDTVVAPASGGCIAPKPMRRRPALRADVGSPRDGAGVAASATVLMPTGGRSRRGASTEEGLRCCMFVEAGAVLSGNVLIGEEAGRR